MVRSHCSFSFLKVSSSAFSAALSPLSTYFNTGGWGGGCAADSGLLVSPRPPNVSLGGAGGSSSTGEWGARARFGDAGAAAAGAPGFLSFNAPVPTTLGPANFVGGARAGTAEGGGGSSFFGGGGTLLAALVDGFFPRTFLGGAVFGAGGGAGGFSFALTTAVSKNSLILVFRMSSRPSI